MPVVVATQLGSVVTAVMRDFFSLLSHDKEGKIEERCSPHDSREAERRMDQEQGVSFGSTVDPEHMSSWILPPCTREMLPALPTSDLLSPGCSASGRRAKLQWPSFSNQTPLPSFLYLSIMPWYWVHHRINPLVRSGPSRFRIRLHPPNPISCLNTWTFYKNTLRLSVPFEGQVHLSLLHSYLFLNCLSPDRKLSGPKRSIVEEPAPPSCWEEIYNWLMW